jgi:hypothetical protein
MIDGVRKRLLAAWLVLPLAAAGTLTAHAVAYAAVGTPPEGVHGYLSHLPLVVAALILPALLAVAVVERTTAPRAWPYAAAALGAFVAQEHLERLAHTGELPFLLDRPVFWLGLALQVPFAVAAWLAARLLVRAAAALRRGSSRVVSRRPAGQRRPRVLLASESLAGRPAAPRGPPVLLPAR